MEEPPQAIDAIPLITLAQHDAAVETLRAENANLRATQLAYTRLQREHRKLNHLLETLRARDALGDRRLTALGEHARARLERQRDSIWLPFDEHSLREKRRNQREQVERGGGQICPCCQLRAVTRSRHRCNHGTCLGCIGTACPICATRDDHNFVQHAV